jgi:2-hydroxycyclohexanecarboxyl-CoA dehydrogenase
MSTPTDRPSLAILAGPPGQLSSAIHERLVRDGFEARTLDGPSRRQMKESADHLVRESGPPSLLVTIPTYHDATPFGEMPPDRWQRLLMAHLGLTVDACAAVVPHMVQAGHGSVVTFSSWLALAGTAGEAYFAAASGSILAFAKSFALEVASKGIRVNCIAVGRLGQDVQPADVADTVSFLHRDGDFFVGQVLHATGSAV